MKTLIVLLLMTQVALAYKPIQEGQDCVSDKDGNDYCFPESYSSYSPNDRERIAILELKFELLAQAVQKLQQEDRHINSVVKQKGDK